MTSRAYAVTRMHLVDLPTMVLLPLGILASAFAVNVVVWAFLPPESRTTGGAMSLPIFMMIAAMFAVARGLPFALGMGSSRRAFTLGTGLTGVLLALGFGTFYLLAQLLERASGGWWLGGGFFDFPWYAGSPPIVTWLLFVLTILGSFLLGAALTAAYVRWQTWAFLVGGPLAILLFGGVAVVVTWRRWWTEVGGWFGAQTPLTTSGWLLLVCAVLMLATYAILRRVRA